MAAPVPPKTYSLRFISGKYQGGEFPLPPNQEIIVGRASDLDMVLVEDMVSRRHSKITTNGDRVFIQDLGSTNGTFVNGERIQQAQLNEGDRILIGTNIIKLVSGDAAMLGRRAGPLEDMRPTGQVRSMSGTIDEVPLPDLLQLFSSSRKTGVLVVRSETDVGKVFLEKGRIAFAAINDNSQLQADKAAYRIMSWRSGSFYMEPKPEGSFPHRLDMSTEGVLMESMRIFDEVNRLAEGLPPPRSRIAVAQPLPKGLGELPPQELEVFQFASRCETIESVLNNTPRPDIEIAPHLLSLLKKGYLVVTEIRGQAASF